MAGMYPSTVTVARIDRLPAAMTKARIDGVEPPTGMAVTGIDATTWSTEAGIDRRHGLNVDEATGPYCPDYCEIPIHL
jgi:hypothetical protein